MHNYYSKEEEDELATARDIAEFEKNKHLGQPCSTLDGFNVGFIIDISSNCTCVITGERRPLCSRWTVWSSHDEDNDSWQTGIPTGRWYGHEAARGWEWWSSIKASVQSFQGGKYRQPSRLLLPESPSAFTCRLRVLSQEQTGPQSYNITTWTSIIDYSL